MDNKGLKWDKTSFTPTAGVEDYDRYRREYVRIFGDRLRPQTTPPHVLPEGGSGNSGDQHSGTS